MTALRTGIRAILGSSMISLAVLPAVGADAPKILAELGALSGVNGKAVNAAPANDGATVLIFLSLECPIANAYTPTLNQLHDDFPAPGVKWVGVCVDPDQSDAEILAHVQEYQLKLDVAADRRGELARKLGATITPEAFVIDSQGKVRYHGRIDDQFAARGVRNARPAGHDLRDALAAVLAGKEVETPYVKPVGCPIPEVDENDATAP